MTPLTMRIILALCTLLVVSAPDAATQQSPATGARPRLLRPADIDTLPLRTAGTRIAYGRDSLQFGELRVPDGSGPFPIAIVIHGGCWYGPYASVRNGAPLADAITAEGVATWNIEYRRYDHPGGGWPGTFRDVGEAIDHVRTLARTHPIDTTRIVALGHSAGAQLAAWGATRGRLATGSALHAPDPLALSGVVSLGGVMDLRAFQTRQRQTCGNPAIESVLGGLPDAVPERYREVSPIERLPLGVPHAHIAGELDRIAPRAEIERFAANARAAGDTVTIEIVPQLGHHDVMAPRTDGGRAAIDAVRRLLRLPERTGRP
jgi:acetyl esterase/lipase